MTENISDNTSTNNVEQHVSAWGAIDTSNSPAPKLNLFQRLWQNIWALVVGWILAYVFLLIWESWVFTADLMNQYGEVVTSYSGSEMVADITTWWMIHIKTTKQYDNVSSFVLTIAYDSDSITVDSEEVDWLWDTVVSTDDNMIVMYVTPPDSTVAVDTTLVSLPYSGNDARWVQKYTVFIWEVDIGADELEWVIMFTNTPPTPVEYLNGWFREF